LEQCDFNAVGDFLAVASSLIEIKSQQVLPRADEVENEVEDPRRELVARLLEYKKFRDAASILEEQSRNWQKQFVRQSSDLPPRRQDVAEQPIHEVELWDLVSAFGRIIRDTQASKPPNIVYDDTPIHVYMASIRAKLIERGRLAFTDLFDATMHKSTLVGIFLAILELVSSNQISVEQEGLFGEIWIAPNLSAAGPIDCSNAENYDHPES